MAMEGAEAATAMEEVLAQQEGQEGAMGWAEAMVGTEMAVTVMAAVMAVAGSSQWRRWTVAAEGPAEGPASYSEGPCAGGGGSRLLADKPAFT